MGLGIRNFSRKLSAFSLLVCVVSLCALFATSAPAQAAAGINQEMNFQGRLLNNQGAIVPDGYYNIEFKIYQDGDGQSTGDSTGSPAGALLWTEDYVDNNANAGVQVVNGYMSVQLGSICAFGGGSCQGHTNAGVNWDSDTLWLSMNIAGDTNTCTSFNGTGCTADGEMTPMKRLSANAYAMNALSSINSQELGGISSGNFVQFATNTLQTNSTTNNSIYINNTSTGNLIDFQTSGVNSFIVNNSGNVVFGANSSHSVSIASASAGNAGQTLTVAAGAAGSGSGTLTGGTLTLDAGAGGGTNGNGGNLVLDAGAPNGSGTAGTVSIGTNYAASITLGGSSAGSTSITSSSTKNVSETAGATSQTVTNTGVTVKTTTNSANAYQVQNNSGYNEFSVSTSGNQTVLGNVTSSSGQGIAGALVFADGTADNLSGLLELSTANALAGSGTIYSLPTGAGFNVSQTVCTSVAASCNSTYQAAGNYINNSTSQQSGANFNISGTGQLATLDATGSTLQVGSTNATTVNLGGTSTNATVAIGSGTTSSNISVGNTSTTGIITIGQYSGTSSSTINIGANAGASTTQTINIGTSNNGTNNVTVGGTSSGSTTKVQGGNTTQTVTNSGDTVKTGANSSTALQVQNASGYNDFTVSTSGNQTTFGNVTSTSGQGIAGALIFADGTNDNLSALLELATPQTSTAIAGSGTIYELPTGVGFNVSQTICTSVASSCSGTYLTSGGGSYIYNQTSLQSSANYNISGTGIAATELETPTLDAATASSTLQVGSTNATTVNIGGTSTNATIAIGSGTTTSNITIGAALTSGTVTIGGTNTSTTTKLQAGNTTETITNSGDTVKTGANSTSAFQVKNSNGTSFFSADSTKDTVNTNELSVGAAANVGLAGRLFSDGFETGNTAAWNGGVGGTGTTNSGAESTTVYSGKYAFEANTTSGHGYYTQTSIASSSTVYARTYFDSTTIGNPTNLLDLGTAAIGSGTHMQITIGASGDICWTAFTGITAGCTATAPSASTWYKLEVELVINNSGSGALQIWLNNTNIKSATTLSTGTVNIANVAVGGSDATTTATTTTYLDDVAVDTVATGDSSSAYVSDSLHVAGSSSFNAAVFEDTTSSSTAFQVQNTSGNQVLDVDTTGSQVVLGKASTVNGQIIFQSSGGSNYVGFAAPTTNPNSSYVLNLPSTAPSASSQCLETSGTFTQLTFSSCGGGSGSYINNAFGTTQAANFNIQGVSSSASVAILEANNGGTGDILDFLNGSGATVGTFDKNGNFVDSATGASSFAGTLTVSTSIKTPTLDTASSVPLNIGSSSSQINLNQNTQITGNQTFANGATNRTISVAVASSGIGSNLTISAGGAGSSGNNGGNLILQGGAGSGIGVAGLVEISTPTFDAITNDANCYTGGSLVASSCTVAQSSVDTYSAVVVGFSTTSQTATLPSPTNTTPGRLFYIMAANGSQNFTLSVNGGGTGNTVAMRQNTSATMVWNGSEWSAAGASSSTTLQAAYDNTLLSAGGAELVVSHTSNTDGLNIRDSSTDPVNGPLLTVQTNSDAVLYSVNSNITEYSSDSGAETQGSSSSTFPSSTWAAIGGTTAVTRYTTAGNDVATGQASVQVATSATTNAGVTNTLTSSLTPNLNYNVSFATRLSSGTFTTMNVYYSVDGTTQSTACITSQIVTISIWTKVNCTFTAPASGITSSNAILIEQSDSTIRTFYVDNLSVTIAANQSYATDGGVDNAGSFSTNWPAVGGATVTRSTTVGQSASDSAQVGTTGANQGVENKLSINPLPSTLYLVTVYADSNTTGFNSFSVTYTPNGGTNTVGCVDYNTQSVSSTLNTFTEITCYITTGSTAVTNPNVEFTQTDSTGRTFYVDTFSMTLSTNATPDVQIGGGLNGGPVTLFTLDRAASAPIASNNEAFLGSMYYDTTLGELQCYEASGWGSCGSSPNTVVTISPEYTNAVMHGTGVGTMTSDICSGALHINDGTSGQPTICNSSSTFNFYKWTSPQATAQTYSIYVTYQLPGTFKSFSSGQTSLIGLTDSTNSTVQYEVYRQDAATGLTQCGSTISVSTGAQSNWQTGTASGASDPSTCSFVANDSIVFKIDVTASSNANAYVSNLNFTFTHF